MSDTSSCAWQREETIRPFVTMRLAHEAVRIALDQLDEEAQKGTGDCGEATFEGLQRLVELHMKQENENFFPLLDEQFENAATGAGLRDEHTADNEHSAEVRAAFKELSGNRTDTQKHDTSEKNKSAKKLAGKTKKQPASDSESESEAESSSDTASSSGSAPTEEGGSSLEHLQSTIKRFTKSHREHLMHEEEVMMPLTLKLGDFAVRAHAVNRLIFIDHVEFTTYMVPYVVSRLATHRPPPMLENYLKGIQAACLYLQWPEVAQHAWNAIPEHIRLKTDHPAVSFLRTELHLEDKPESKKDESRDAKKVAESEDKKERTKNKKPAKKSESVESSSIKQLTMSAASKKGVRSEKKAVKKEDKKSAKLFKSSKKSSDAKPSKESKRSKK